MRSLLCFSLFLTLLTSSWASGRSEKDNKKELRKRRSAAAKERRAQRKELYNQYKLAYKGYRDKRKGLDKGLDKTLKKMHSDLKLFRKEIDIDLRKSENILNAKREELMQGFFLGQAKEGGMTPEKRKELGDKLKAILKEINDKRLQREEKDHARSQKLRKEVAAKHREHIQSVLELYQQTNLAQYMKPIPVEPINGELTKNEKREKETQEKKIAKWKTESAQKINLFKYKHGRAALGFEQRIEMEELNIAMKRELNEKAINPHAGLELFNLETHTDKQKNAQNTMIENLRKSEKLRRDIETRYKNLKLDLQKKHNKALVALKEKFEF